MLASSDFFLKTKLKKPNQLLISFLYNYKPYTSIFYNIFTYNKYFVILSQQSLQYMCKLLLFTNLYQTDFLPSNRN